MSLRRLKINYSQEKLNQILVSKPLDAFYFAIVENRGELLTDEEYEKIISSSHNVYTNTSKDKEEVDSLLDCFQESEQAKEFILELMKMVYSLARIRHMAILTMIDDAVYDIANIEFVDLKRNKIVHYDDFTDYYDETNARIRFFTPEEEPQLKQKTVLVDVSDESIVYA